VRMLTDILTWRVIVMIRDAAINPDAVDICDKIDNNCDSEVDEDADTEIYYHDHDGDGYGDPNDSIEDCEQPAQFVLDNTDCDDNDLNVFPGAYDICENGIDEDCSGEDRECGETPSVCANLADVPLETQVEAAPPMVMMLLDDSGSMAWSLLCPEKNGLFKGQDNFYDVDEYWKSQYAGYNGIYYDPEVDYSPWPDSFNKEYDDADINRPKNHPDSTSTRNLSGEFDDLDM
jgi:type IV pilus assembly protein PilY1